MTVYETKCFQSVGSDMGPTAKAASDWLTTMAQDRWVLAAQSGGDHYVWLTIRREDPPKADG